MIRKDSAAVKTEVDFQRIRQYLFNTMKIFKAALQMAKSVENTVFQDGRPSFKASDFRSGPSVSAPC